MDREPIFGTTSPGRRRNEWTALCDKLAAEYGATPEEFGGLVEQVADRFRDARVEAFVPILVERYAREEAARRRIGDPRPQPA